MPCERGVERVLERAVQQIRYRLYASMIVSGKQRVRPTLKSPLKSTHHSELGPVM